MFPGFYEDRKEFTDPTRKLNAKMYDWWSHVWYDRLSNISTGEGQQMTGIKSNAKWPGDIKLLGS